MTTLLDAEAQLSPSSHPSGDATSPRPRRIGLAAHVLAVTVVLFAAGLIVGIDGVVSADEGAVLGQAQILNRTDGYAMRYWAEPADPSGRWFPFHLAERHGDDWLLFTKKPAYVELVAAADRWGGRFLILGVHAVGVGLAAAAAAVMARRLRPGSEVLALWATGTASPLALDGMWVIAHAPAAAMTGLMFVSVIRWWDSGRRRHLVAVSGALVAATLLRNEATLLGLAVVLAGISYVAAPSTRWRGAALAVAAAVGTAVGVLVNAVWQRFVEGGTDAGLYIVRDRTGWIAARVEALWNMFLSPQADGGPWTGGLVFIAGLLIIVAWSAPIRERERWNVTLTGLAVAALIARLVLVGFLVPGFMAAWPVGVAAAAIVWPLRRRVLGSDVAAILVRIVGLTVAAVWATTYASGGTGDWGGRYLHLVVPAAGALVVVAVVGALDRRPNLAGGARWLAAAGVMVTLIGVSSFRQASINAATVVRAAESNPDRPNPVVVSTSPAYGRFAHEAAVSGRFLTIDPARDVQRQGLELRRLRPDVVVGPRASVAELIDALVADGSLAYGDERPLGEQWVVRYRIR